MSMEGFQVEPEAIRDGGSGIRDAADQLRARLGAFQGELAGFGQPWGNDDLGSLIGMCYQAISDVAMECYQRNIEELGYMGEGVEIMADNYEDADASTVDRFSGIG